MEYLGYSEDSEGNVVLRMTVEDYQLLLMCMGYATGAAGAEKSQFIGLINRLNKGNQNFVPYKIKV